MKNKSKKELFESNEIILEKKNFGQIIRPSVYEEIAILKVAETSCFYLSKDKKTYDKDFTMTIVTELDAKFKKQYNILKQDEEYEKICRKIAEEKNKKGNFDCNPEQFLVEIKIGEKNISISIDEYNEYVNKNKNDIPKREKEKMEKLLAIEEKDLVDGRLFEKRIPFSKVMEFVDKIFSDDFSFANEIYLLIEKTKIFEKRTDMWFFQKLFSFIKNYTVKEKVVEEIKKDTLFNDFKKIFVMDILYGIVPDTCNSVFRSLLCYSLVDGLENSCEGECNCHTKDEGTAYGPITFLEMILCCYKDKKQTFLGVNPIVSRLLEFMKYS